MDWGIKVYECLRALNRIAIRQVVLAASFFLFKTGCTGFSNLYKLDLGWHN
ncbi:hypothetical protein KFK09_007918 [Dendrobium nobile]|uniref:Uncharacterized protein n=1 Tax=Dendrobium nobile TaxID=94219 RepID=A0A8T3BY71_DENNO|nr:hypothetical protein KFK09_007918 [Dendrobium nobile]